MPSVLPMLGGGAAARAAAGTPHVRARRRVDASISDDVSPAESALWPNQVPSHHWQTELDRIETFIERQMLGAAGAALPGMIAALRRLQCVMMSHKNHLAEGSQRMTSAAEGDRILADLHAATGRFQATVRRIARRVAAAAQGWVRQDQVRVLLLAATAETAAATQDMSRGHTCASAAQLLDTCIAEYAVELGVRGLGWGAVHDNSGAVRMVERTRNALMLGAVAPGHERIIAGCEMWTLFGDLCRLAGPQMVSKTGPLLGAPRYTPPPQPVYGSPVGPSHEHVPAQGQRHQYIFPAPPQQSAHMHGSFKLRCIADAQLNQRSRARTANSRPANFHPAPQLGVEDLLGPLSSSGGAAAARAPSLSHVLQGQAPAHACAARRAGVPPNAAPAAPLLPGRRSYGSCTRDMHGHAAAAAPSGASQRCASGRPLSAADEVDIRMRAAVERDSADPVAGGGTHLAMAACDGPVATVAAPQSSLLRSAPERPHRTANTSPPVCSAARHQPRPIAPAAPSKTQIPLAPVLAAQHALPTRAAEHSPPRVNTPRPLISERARTPEVTSAELNTAGFIFARGRYMHASEPAVPQSWSSAADPLGASPGGSAASETMPMPAAAVPAAQPQGANGPSPPRVNTPRLLVSKRGRAEGAGVQLGAAEPAAKTVRLQLADVAPTVLQSEAEDVSVERAGPPAVTAPLPSLPSILVSLPSMHASFDFSIMRYSK